LDDDDRLAEGALAALSRALDRTGAGVAVGTVVPFGDPRVLAHERAYFERAAEVLRGCRTRFDLVAALLYKDAPLINSACMLRRSCAVSLGGYDPDIAYCEDAELYLRAVRDHGFVFVDRTVAYYRAGQPSLMHDLPRNSRRLQESYRAIYDKYRAQHGSLELFAMKALARVPRRAPELRALPFWPRLHHA
jgi:GT2 family glycosyltransferase